MDVVVAAAPPTDSRELDAEDVVADAVLAAAAAARATDRANMVSLLSLSTTLQSMEPF